MSLQTFHCFRMLLKLRKFLQNWGDYADMNQAGIVYLIFACDVFLICWFGTQVTQHVRENDVHNFLNTLCT